jgi:hypothetical protein
LPPGARLGGSLTRRKAAEEMVHMHRNEQKPVNLFGKAYFWSKSPAGNLVLVSVASLAPMMDKINETFAKLDQING